MLAPEYDFKWKEVITPKGRTVATLRAWPRRTSGNGCGGWRSPQNRKKGGGEYSDPQKALDRTASGHQVNLEDQAKMAGWPTATGRDMKDVGNMENTPTNALLGRTVLGANTFGYPAPTASNGVLNPEFSRWLMGYPEAWDTAAPYSRFWDFWQRLLKRLHLPSATG